MHNTRTAIHLPLEELGTETTIETILTAKGHSEIHALREMLDATAALRRRMRDRLYVLEAGGIEVVRLRAESRAAELELHGKDACQQSDAPQCDQSEAPPPVAEPLTDFEREIFRRGEAAGRRR